MSGKSELKRELTGLAVISSVSGRAGTGVESNLVVTSTTVLTGVAFALINF